MRFWRWLWKLLFGHGKNDDVKKKDV